MKNDKHNLSFFRGGGGNLIIDANLVVWGREHDLHVAPVVITSRFGMEFDEHNIF